MQLFWCKVPGHLLAPLLWGGAPKTSNGRFKSHAFISATTQQICSLISFLTNAPMQFHAQHWNWSLCWSLRSSFLAMSVKVFVMKPKHFKNFVLSFGRARFFSLTTLSFLFCHPDLCLNWNEFGEIMNYTFYSARIARTYVRTCMYTILLRLRNDQNKTSITHKIKKRPARRPGPHV